MSLVKSVQQIKRPHRKVKTGCKTCRVRRVKCDEGFPACRRCLLAGRVCDGYGIWGGGGSICVQDGGTEAAQTKLSGPTTKAISTIVQSHVQPLMLPGTRLSAQEQSYLDWFIHATAVQTPRIFNSPFWDPLVLRSTMQQPMVLNALLALSAVHKRKVTDPANRVRDGLAPDSLEIFFLKQYNGALRTLQDILNDTTRSRRSRLMLSLIMCGIFVLLEYLRGNSEAGEMHLITGSKLAKQLLQGPDDEAGKSKFIQFFARLEDQSQAPQEQEQEQDMEQAQEQTQEQTQKEPKKKIAAPLSISVEISPQLRFVSLAEANHHLNSLVHMVAHSIEQARNIPHSRTGSRRLLEDEYAYTLESFGAWDQAFEATFRDKLPGMALEEIEAWKALKERFVIAKEDAQRPLIFKDHDENDPNNTASTEEEPEPVTPRSRSTMLLLHEDQELQKQFLFTGPKWHP